MVAAMLQRAATETLTEQLAGRYDWAIYDYHLTH